MIYYFFIFYKKFIIRLKYIFSFFSVGKIILSKIFIFCFKIKNKKSQRLYTKTFIIVFEIIRVIQKAKRW